MPSTDGTGPMGFGPMTGGRRGRCAAGAPDGDGGSGRGGGAPRGRGGRNRFGRPGQRARQADARPAEALARMEGALGDVVERHESTRRS
jgi:hypothetical protein